LIVRGGLGKMSSLRRVAVRGHGAFQQQSIEAHIFQSPPEKLQDIIIILIVLTGCATTLNPPSSVMPSVRR
jgi:hypothetical protein